MNQILNIIVDQYEAAFSTLNLCIAECDDKQWESRIANLTFSQAAFHTLFYADLYLNNDNDDSFQSQQFHLQNTDSFRDYEELKNQQQTYSYSLGFIESYLAHCRQKLHQVFESATEDWLNEASPFRWIPSTRGEVHIYNIRHIQHHAAQLIMRLRLDGLEDFPWFRSGWQDNTSSS